MPKPIEKKKKKKEEQSLLGNAVQQATKAATTATRQATSTASNTAPARSSNNNTTPAQKRRENVQSAAKETASKVSSATRRNQQYLNNQQRTSTQRYVETQKQMLNEQKANTQKTRAAVEKSWVDRSNAARGVTGKNAKDAWLTSSGSLEKSAGSHIKTAARATEEKTSTDYQRFMDAYNVQKDSLDKKLQSGRISQEQYDRRLSKLQSSANYQTAMKMQENQAEGDKRVQKLYEKGEKLVGKGQERIDKALEGKSRLGRMALGALESGTGMASDIALGMATGGSALPAMWSRVFGERLGAVEAQGGTRRQDELNAAGQATLEVATELMFMGTGLGKKALGKSGRALFSPSEKLADWAVKGLNGRKADFAHAAIKYLSGTVEEGAEELASWIFSPLLDNITYANSLDKMKREEIRGDLQAQSNSIRQEMSGYSLEEVQMMSAYLGSDKFLNDIRQQYLDSGVDEETANVMAESMRDYLSAAAIGDVDGMEEVENRMVDSLMAMNPVKQGWSREELEDTLGSTAIMTMITGLPGAVTSTVKGRAFLDSASPEQIARIIIDTKNAEDTVSAAKAKAAEDRLASGKELTATQATELLQGYMEHKENLDSKRSAGLQLAEKESDRQGYIQITNQRGQIVAGEKTQETIDEASRSAEDALERIIQDNEDTPDFQIPDEIDEMRYTDAVVNLQVGALTADDVDAILSSPLAQTLVTAETGFDFGLYTVRARNGEIDRAATNMAIADALFKTASQNLVETARVETEHWMNVEKGKVVGEQLKMFGSNGQVALQEALDDFDERDTVEYRKAAYVAGTLYSYARNTGAEWDLVRESAKGVGMGIDESVLKKMYEAGLQDRDAAMDKARGMQVKIDEAISKVTENQEPVRGNLDYDEEVEALGTDLRLFSEIAKGLNVDIHLSVGLTNSEGQPINGMYMDGEMWLNVPRNADEVKWSIGYTFMHEVTHHLEKYAPQEYEKLMNAVRERWEEQDPEGMRSRISEIIKRYADYGQKLTETQALQEIIADGAHEFLNDEEFVNRLCEDDPSLAKAVINSIKNALRKLRELFGKVEDPLHKQAIFSQLDMLAEAEELWLNAYKTAVANRAIVGLIEWDERAGQYSTEERYSATQEEMDAHRQALIDEVSEYYDSPYTNNYGETGWIFPDGKMLRMGMDGERGDDHRIASHAYEGGISQSEGLRRFNNEGNIRFSPESNSLEFGTGVEPTTEQYAWIEKMVNRRGISMIEFTDLDNNSADYRDYEMNEEYPSGYEVVQDIKRFYRSGEIGGSEVNQFRFSIPEETIDNLNDLGAGVTEGGSVVKLSVTSWEDTDVDTLRQNLIDAGYEEAVVDKWIADVNGVAATILGDRSRLDYTADQFQDALKENAEYYYTLDLSTLCQKRRLYQGTYNAIMHRLVNRGLQPDDTIRIRQMMDELGHQVPCGICYEESRKKNEGKFAERWLNGYGKKWKGYKNIEHEDPYIPTIDEVTTTDGRERLREEHPEAYESYIQYQKTRGSANPKVSFTHTDYRGDILRLTPSEVSKLRHIGGLRIQSFSDFETVHVIDMMQAVLDMAAMKLTSQAYTKVPAFADIFGGTGIKINLSLIGKVNPETGELEFDAKEGMDPKEAFRLREKYSKNVGTIIVGANDASILAAWKDDRIDMVIPFHRSGWGKKEFERLGLTGYKDFTKGQTERYLMNGKDMALSTASKELGLTGEAKLQPIYAEDYWDETLSGTENAKRYLELCAEKHYRPVFYQFLHDNGDGSWSLQEDGSTDGYWKSLIDFKMYDNEGNFAKQEEVKADFDMDAAQRTMDSFEGNADTLPVAEDVVDAFIEEYKQNHPNVKIADEAQFSISAEEDADYMSAVESGNMEEAQRMVDEAARRAGYSRMQYHQTPARFTEFNINRNTNSNNESLFPYGIFTKQSDKDIGIEGDIQMPLYVKVQKVLSASTREEMEGRIPGYSMFREAIKEIDDEFDALYENAEEEYFDAMDTYLDTHEEEAEPYRYGDYSTWQNYTDNIDDPIFQRAKDRLNGIEEEWRSRVNTKSAEARAYVTEWLRANGYDGFEVAVDQGSFGRSTDTLVLLDKNQAKSADPVTYDNDGNVVPLSQRFDPTNNDIRFSIPAEDADGNELSQGQREFFAGSKAVDEQGRLVPVYHTTNNGGFTVFDPSFSDDHRSLFFTSSQEVSNTYAHGSREVRRFDVYNDVNRSENETKKVTLAEIESEYPDFVNDLVHDHLMQLVNLETEVPLGSLKGYDEEFASRMLKTWDRQASLGGDNYDDMMGVSIDGAEPIKYREFQEWLSKVYAEVYSENATKRGYYQSYLNLRNPLIMDGRNRNWNNLNDPESRIVDREWEMYTDDSGKQRISYSDNGGESVEVSYEDASEMLGWSLLDKLEVRWFTNDYGSLSTKWDVVENTVGQGLKTRQIAEYAYEKGYDGVIIKNIVDIGPGKEIWGRKAISDIYIAFDGRQVKDTRNLNPTDDLDIRFSTPDEDDVLARLAEEAEDVENLPLTDPVLEEGRVRMNKSKEQFLHTIGAKWNERWYTEGKVLKEKSIEKDVRSLVMAVMQDSDTTRQYKSDLVKTVMRDAKVAYNLMKSGKLKDASEVLWKSALNMIENVDFFEEDLDFDTYKEIRQFLRGYRMTLDPKYYRDVDYGALRKRNMGKLLLVKRGGTSVDQVYQELAEQWPDIFDEEEHYNPADQLLHIEEVIRNNVDPYRRAYTSEEAAKEAWNIASDLFDIVYEGEEYKSIADTYKNKYDSMAKAMKTRHEEAMTKVRNSYEEKLQKQKEQAKESKEAAVEKERAKGEKEKAKAEKKIETIRQRGQKKIDKLRAALWEANERVEGMRIFGEIAVQKEKRKAQEKERKQKEIKEHAKHFGHILENYDWLAERVLSPTKEKNVPEELRKPLAEMLQFLDLQTERSKSLEEKTGKVAQKTLKMRELKDKLNALAKRKGTDEVNTSTFEIDALVEDMLEKMSNKLDGASVDALDIEDLKHIDILLKTIRQNIQRSNAIRIEGENIATAAKASQFVKDMQARVDLHGQKRKRGSLDHIVNMGMLTPTAFFQRTGAMYDVYMEMRRGFDTYIRNEKMIMDEIKKIMEPYYEKRITSKGQMTKPGSTIESWSTDEGAQTFDLTHGSITLSVAQMMSLYCLQRREQAKGHMFVGGVVATPIQTGSKLQAAVEKVKGKTEQAQALVLTDADINTIIEKLTPEQKGVADALQQLMATKMAKIGNEAHRELYGYEIFDDPNYFPIRSSSDVVQTDINNPEQALNKIKNYGAAKPLVPHADNALVLDDIFDVVAENCNGMNLYSSYLVPLTDFMRFYNATGELEDGTVKTVKVALKEAYGDMGQEYVMNFMRDINGIKQVGRGGAENLLNNILGMSKRAAVFGNIRVALQQPTAVVRAFAVIDPKYFVGKDTGPSKEALREMLEHCPIAQWKAWGFYDAYMGRDIKDVMFNTWSISDELLAGIYGELDNRTWAWIWTAVKNEVKDTHPDVEVGSQEFWDLCNKRASYVFDSTQVVDSTFHRSNDMRNKSVMMKVLTAFQAEPTLTFNVFRTGIADAYDKWLQGDKTAAAKILARATSVIVAQALVVSFAQALADAWRGKNPKLPWGDDDDLEKMTKEELLAFALNHGITGVDSKMKKAELLEVIQAQYMQKYADGWRGSLQRYNERVVKNTIKNFFDNANMVNNIEIVKDFKQFGDYIFSITAENHDWPEWLRFVMGWDQTYLFSSNNMIFSGAENIAKGYADISNKSKQIRKDKEEGAAYTFHDYYDTLYAPIQKFGGGIGSLVGFPLSTFMRDTKPIWDKIFDSMAVYADDELPINNEELQQVSPVTDKKQSKNVVTGVSSKDYKEIIKQVEKEGLSGDAFNKRVAQLINQKSEGVSTEYYNTSEGSSQASSTKAVQTFDTHESYTHRFASDDAAIKAAEKRISQITTPEKNEWVSIVNEKTMGLSGQARKDKIWDIVGTGYTDRVEKGDYAYVQKVRAVLQETGGDVDAFDRKVLAESKTALKKTLVNDPTPIMLDRQQRIKEYLLSQGVSEEEISSEILYKTNMARDLKAALRTGNKDYIMAELKPLVQAGLTYEDFQKLYKYRNYGAKTYDGKYADPKYTKSTGKYSWPVNGEITSSFGYRGAVEGADVSPFHKGIDIAGNMGDPVAAADGGTVLAVNYGYNGGFGNQVKIRHADGTITWYNHLSGANVKPGDTVGKGDQIGQVGSTGESTGPHLDFMVEVDGEYIDPLEYLSV